MLERETSLTVHYMDVTKLSQEYRISGLYSSFTDKTIPLHWGLWRKIVK